MTHQTKTRVKGLLVPMTVVVQWLTPAVVALVGWYVSQVEAQITVLDSKVDALTIKAEHTTTQVHYIEKRLDRIESKR